MDLHGGDGNYLRSLFGVCAFARSSMPHDSSPSISFARSDASDSRLPQPHQLDRTAYHGKVDYFHKVEPNEPANQRWLKTVNRLLANVHREAGRITGWPHGYVLYVRRRGPMNVVRQDYYLLGMPCVTPPNCTLRIASIAGGPHRFRSPAEFVPHAAW